MRCVKSDPICGESHTDFKTKILDTFNIYDEISCCVEGTRRTDKHAICGLSHGTNNGQLESELSENGSTTTAVTAAKTNAKHKAHVHAMTPMTLHDFIHTFYIFRCELSVKRSPKSTIASSSCLSSTMFVFSNVAFDHQRFGENSS